MTERHYAQGSAVGNAATARVQGMLGAERAGRPSVREQLEQIDEGELARLLELLAESKKGGPQRTRAESFLNRSHGLFGNTVSNGRGAG